MCCLAEDITDTINEEDSPFTYIDPDTGGKPTCEDSLSPTQLTDLRTIWQRFHSVLNSNPGHTNIVEHRISTGQARPIRLLPYRIPYAYHDAVRDELRQMEQDGIIETSSSEWGAPNVKKDSTIRMCVDYRRLNTVSKMDAYPIPHIDDLIDRLGDTRFITTLGLLASTCP